MRAALGVILLVVSAGCVGVFGGSESAEQGTVPPPLQGTPTASPTPTPEPNYPPGVTTDGVAAFRLASAHEDSVAGDNTTVRYRRTVRSPNGTLLSGFGFEARTQGTRFLVDLHGRVAEPVRPKFARGNRTIWSNETLVAIRQESADGTVDYRLRERNSLTQFAPFTSGRAGVYEPLIGQSLSVTRAIQTPNGTVYVLRGTVERPVSRLGETVRNGTVELRVGTDGVVRSLDIRYETTIADRSVVVTARYETVARTGTTVERPAWVDDAVNRSDGGYPGEYDG